MGGMKDSSGAPLWPRLVLLGAILPLCWLGMMAVHEAGHVCAAWLTGGVVTQVVLHPLAISRTDVDPNPQPHLVAWMGPLCGVLLPLCFWGAAEKLRWPGAFLLRFFTGFCLIANGLYIGIGSVDRIGDAGDLLRNGSPHWVLWAFGAIAAPGGIWLWHGQSRYFGLGTEAEPVAAEIAWLTLGLLLALTAMMAIGSAGF